MDTEQYYNKLCNLSSDINEHLPTLKRYASECDHVTEMGVRWVVSTFAFAVAKPKKFISIDIVDPRNLIQGTLHWNNHQCGDRMNSVIDYCRLNNVYYQFILGDTTDIEIEETDLLFIDTLHSYTQLKTELSLHSHKVKKYIILHDTESYKYTNEDSIGNIGTSSKDKNGLLPALEEFLESNSNWKIREIFVNCNGLTVLERISDESL
jgi:hypothetical protein